MSATTAVEATPTPHRQEVAAGDRFEFGKTGRRSSTPLTNHASPQPRHPCSRCSGAPTWPDAPFSTSAAAAGCSALPPAARVRKCIRSTTTRTACRARARSGDASPPTTRNGQSSRDRSSIASHGRAGNVRRRVLLGSPPSHRPHVGSVYAACRAVRPEGGLFIALYNDLGTRSQRWRRIKRLYNRLPGPCRPLLTAATIAPDEAKTLGRLICPAVHSPTSSCGPITETAA